MRKARNKKVSILLVLAMLVTFVFPLTALAADPVVFSNAVQKGIDDNSTTNLGWIKINIDEDSVPADAEYYVSVTLPNDVDFTAALDAANVADFMEVIDEDAEAVELVDETNFELVGTSDTDEYTIKLYPDVKVDYIKLNFSTEETSQVFVDSGFKGNIDVDVEVTGVADGFELWDEPYAATLTVGQTGSAEIAVTAGDPKPVSSGAGKQLAKITLDENLASALNEGDVITLELVNDDDFQFSGVTVTDGKYDLAGTGEVVDGNTIEVTIDFESATLADVLKITPSITVYPSAKGDVEVEVTCSTNDDVEEGTFVVGTVGDVDTTIDVSDDADSLYVATLASGDNEIATIELTGSSDYAEGAELILTLPEGFEWDGENIDAVAEDAGLTSNGVFDSNRSVWLEVGELPDTDTITLDGLQINIAADAPLGDIELEITGDIIEDTVVVGKCIGRAEFTAENIDVRPGVEVAAGNITITEPKKGSLAAGDITLTLPAGVEFANEPTVEVNGDELPAGQIEINEDVCTITLEAGDLLSAKIDTIVISDIEYDIDSRMALKGIQVKLNGDALNRLEEGSDINDTDSGDAVASVFNATVVSATKSTAIMTIGSTTMTVNGKAVTMDVAPYISGDRTFLPVRFVANALGVADSNIIWDGAAQKVTIIKGDRVIQLTIGSNVMMINGTAITMDVAPVIASDRTMLPIRYVAQALGADVQWDAATQTVTVTVN